MLVTHALQDAPDMMPTSTTRPLLTALAVALAAALPASAQTPRNLTLAVSEGTSGGIDAATARKKYAPMAERLSAALGAQVSVLFVREFAALEQGMKDKRFDFVVARPSDYPARGLRDYNYQFVATAQPDGHCMLAVTGDSPLRNVKDLRGKVFVLPEQVAYMTRFCRAELRDQGIDLDQEHVFYVREQGAIPFGLENRIADVGGLASYSGAIQQWREKDQRVLHKSVSQPYMPVVASPALSTDDIARAQRALTTLGADEAGRSFLKQLRIDGFTADGEERLRKLLAWLGV